jgi:hypothetical protein
VTLFHAIERDAPATIHDEPHLTSAVEARSYLSKVAAHSVPARPRVTTHVHIDRVDHVARSIVAHADELHAGLIVLCTHSSGGLRQLVFGSIAQQCWRWARRRLADAAGWAWNHAAVCPPARAGALDGDPEHAHAMPVEAELAQTCGAAIHLVVVVATRGALMRERAATAALLLVPIKEPPSR